MNAPLDRDTISAIEKLEWEIENLQKKVSGGWGTGKQLRKMDKQVKEKMYMLRWLKGERS